MGFKKERRERLRERRALDRIRELSGALMEVTNSFERLVGVDRRHVAGVAFEQTVNVLSRSLLDAVDELGTIYHQAPERPE